jgi:hypothetical protein
VPEPHVTRGAAVVDVSHAHRAGRTRRTAFFLVHTDIFFIHTNIFLRKSDDNPRATSAKHCARSRSSLEDHRRGRGSRYRSSRRSLG